MKLVQKNKQQDNQWGDQTEGFKKNLQPWKVKVYQTLSSCAGKIANDGKETH